MMRTSLPQMPANFYRHADQPIFLLLLVSGEGVLVHDDNRSEEVGCLEASEACHDYG